VNARSRISVLLVALVASPSAHSLDYPLSPEEVRQAYFFGRSSDRGKVSEFLGQYIRVFQPHEGGTFVGRIELCTPYQRVVRRSWDNQADYSAQQAQIDYDVQADMVGVRVFLHISRGAGQSDLYSDREGHVLDRREGFWRDFQFRVKQEEHVIQPKKIAGRPLYGRRGQGLSGAEVELEYDVNELTPGQMRISVTAPGGRTTTADFPLDRLK
jgi:hypothetical protein